MKTKILYWSPRILALLAILFMMLFSADCFSEYSRIGQKMTCFLMHNIPSFILIGTLLFAWKWEFEGGIAFLLLTVIASLFFRTFTGNPWSGLILLPFLLTGVLFILSSKLKSKSKN